MCINGYDFGDLIVLQMKKIQFELTNCLVFHGFLLNVCEIQVFPLKHTSILIDFSLIISNIFFLFARRFVRFVNCPFFSDQ